jgi:hypothetical protein
MSNRWKIIHQKEQESFCDKTSKGIVLKSAICGFVAGDGCITVRKMKSGVHCELRFYPDDEDMLYKYCDALKYVYGKDPNVYVKDNVYNVCLTSKTVVENLLKCGSFGTSDWTVPHSLFSVTGAKEAWLKAFFSSEAYVCSKYIRVQTININGMNEVSKLLHELGIDHRCYDYNSSKSCEASVKIINIGTKEARRKYFEIIGFWHLNKERKLRESLNL